MDGGTTGLSELNIIIPSGVDDTWEKGSQCIICVGWSVRVDSFVVIVAYKELSSYAGWARQYLIEDAT